MNLERHHVAGMSIRNVGPRAAIDETAGQMPEQIHHMRTGYALDERR
jgi:hypothetical protein